MPKPAVVAGVIVATVLVAPQAASQDSFEFVFTNPGARSMGLGGAFAAIADDATAAFANPAGLVQLVKKEISGELRLNFDTSEGTSNRETDLTGLQFLSFVMPLGDWSLAAYTHQVASVDLVPEISTAQHAIGFTVNAYSVAGAYRISEGLAVGLGASYFRGDLTGPGVLSDDDVTWGANGGVLWTPARWVNLAAFYRQGASFRFATAASGSVPLDFPDVGGVGVAFRPGNGSITVGAEWDHVRPTSVLLSTLGELTAFDVAASEELHLGAELAVLSWTPVTAFRLGTWLDPGADGAPAIAVPLGDPTLRGVDEWHVAGGFGMAWTRFQFDIGLDHADRETSFSFSMIFSF